MYLDRLKQRVLAVIRGIQGLRTANRLKEKYSVIIGVEIVTKQTFAPESFGSELADFWQRLRQAIERRERSTDVLQCFSLFTEAWRWISSKF